MRKLFTFIILALPFLASSQAQTTYNVASVATMKTYAGTSARVHVAATNSDYVLCSACTADETKVFAGASGRKWQKTITDNNFTDAYKTKLDTIHSTTITTGSAAQYFKGDFSLGTFPTDLTYFPGGILSGTTNTGYVGFHPQTTAVTTPADGFKMYDSAGITFLRSDGYRRVLSFQGVNANSKYNFPISVTADTLVTLTAPQTLTNKTFNNITSNSPTFSGSIKTSGSAPSVAVNTGAGTGATASIAAGGNDISFLMIINTGTSPATSSIVATVTFSTTLPSTPKSIQYSAASNNAGTTARFYLDRTTVSTTTLVFRSGSTALNPSSEYAYYVTVSL